MGHKKKQDHTDVLSFVAQSKIRGGTSDICVRVAQTLMETADGAAANAGCSFDAV